MPSGATYSESIGDAVDGAGEASGRTESSRTVQSKARGLILRGPSPFPTKAWVVSCSDPRLGPQAATASTRTRQAWLQLPFDMSHLYADRIQDPPSPATGIGREHEQHVLGA
jgi:hypothetical protein